MAMFNPIDYKKSMADLKLFAIIILPELFSCVWQGISLVYLESGAYEWELDVNTKFIGASFVYLGYCILFIYFSFFGFVKSKKRYDRAFVNYLPSRKLTLATFILIICILFDSNVIGNKYYYLHNNSAFYNLVEYFIPYIVFLSVMQMSNTADNTKYLLKTRLYFIVVSLALFSYSIVTGNKFSFTLSMLSPLLFVFPRIFNNFSVGRLLFGALIFCSAVIAPVIIYGMNHYHNSFEYFFDRILVLQGGVFWLSYDYALSGNFNPVDFLEFVVGNMSNNSTIHYLMKEFVPLKYSEIINNGVLYSGGFPAVLLVINNWFIALPILALYSFFYGSLVSIIFYSLVCKSYLLSTVAFSLFLNYYQFVGNGSFTNFFNISFYLKLAIFLVVYRVFSKQNHAKKIYI